MLKKLLTASVLAVCAMNALAEDRALLIGVGEYPSPQVPNLKGIDLDINMMQKTAKLMGFDAIKSLLNEQATLNNVTHTIEDYLVNGVSSNDRVLIYFSGHGTQIPDENGDEQDGVDEVLVMQDARPATIAGKSSFAGVLVDDQLNTLLKRIPSHNILVLLDACHSGTSTKSLSLTRGTLGEGIQVMSKGLNYPGMPMSTKGNFMASQHVRRSGFVAISAAGDTESAQATDKGSLFTLGVSKAVKSAVKNQTSLTPNSLKVQATAYIQAENIKEPFTPRLSGNEQLANKAIKLRAPSEGHGVNWQKLVALVGKASPLALSINQKSYAKGDKLVITVKNNQAGYLNVINVGPKDEATVLFPNQFNPNSKVSSSVTIPTKEMNFDLLAQEPFGQSLTVAFFTTKPLNLYQSGDGSRDAKGNVDNMFHSLSELGLKQMKSFGAYEKMNNDAPSIRAGKVITRVCATNC